MHLYMFTFYVKYGKILLFYTLWQFANVLNANEYKANILKGGIFP